MMRALPILLITVGALLACGGAPSDNAGSPPSQGEIVFNANCATCHGRKGDLGLNGSKDLTKSTLKREEVIAKILIGGNGMMPYKDALSKKEIDAVADHVLTLRVAPTKE